MSDIPTGEAVRPRLHFTPRRNWINDPNGLILHDGEYHLFYQYNPQGDRWGHMSWGHAVSRDLVSWDELPVAIPEDEAFMAYSGCCVFDAENSSGLGTADNPPLVAVYTGATRGGGAQVQMLASSVDKGRSWTKFTGNPVLDIGLADFRDPKVFWHGETARWVMLLVRATEHRASFYTSPDLKSWTHTSDFGPEGFALGPWECPDLMRLPIEGEPGEYKWVLKVDSMPKGDWRGAGQYFVGDFDGTRFVNTQPHAPPQRLDFGDDYYAAIAFADTPGRTIMLGWMSNWLYAQDVPTSPWRGAMSLPREVTLARAGDQFELRQWPVRESGEPVPLALPFEFDVHDGVIDGSIGATGGIALRAASGEALRVQSGKDGLVIDRTTSGTEPFASRFAASVVDLGYRPDPAVPWRVVIDGNLVEIFIDGGRRTIAAQFFAHDPRWTLASP